MKKFKPNAEAAQQKQQEALASSKVSKTCELCSFLVYGGKRRKGVSCWIKQTTSKGIHHE